MKADWSLAGLIGLIPLGIGIILLYPVLSILSGRALPTGFQVVPAGSPILEGVTLFTFASLAVGIVLVAIGFRSSGYRPALDAEPEYKPGSNAGTGDDRERLELDTIRRDFEAGRLSWLQFAQRVTSLGDDPLDAGVINYFYDHGFKLRERLRSEYESCQLTWGEFCRVVAKLPMVERTYQGTRPVGEPSWSGQSPERPRGREWSSYGGGRPETNTVFRDANLYRGKFPEKPETYTVFRDGNLYRGKSEAEAYMKAHAYHELREYDRQRHEEKHRREREARDY